MNKQEKLKIEDASKKEESEFIYLNNIKKESPNIDISIEAREKEIKPIDNFEAVNSVSDKKVSKSVSKVRISNIGHDIETNERFSIPEYSNEEDSPKKECNKNEISSEINEKPDNEPKAPMIFRLGSPNLPKKSQQNEPSFRADLLQMNVNE